MAPSDLSRCCSLEKEIVSLKEKKALVSLPHRSTMGFTSTLFLSSKQSGVWLPIINLWPLNAFIRHKHFRMETLATVLQSLLHGWWAATLDLKDAYLYIPFHRDHQNFLQLKFQCLSFSLSTAPRNLTKITKVIAAALLWQQLAFTYVSGRLAHHGPFTNSHSTSLVKNYPANL